MKKICSRRSCGPVPLRRITYGLTTSAPVCRRGEVCGSFRSHALFQAHIHENPTHLVKVLAFTVEWIRLCAKKIQAGALPT
jgi:hypothetical protein